VTKREWQIEMANRFAKRDNDIEELDTRSYLIGRYDSTKTLTDEEILQFRDKVPYSLGSDLIDFARAILRKAQDK
jgi:hypothetical protein